MVWERGKWKEERGMRANVAPQPHENLVAWQKAIDLVMAVYDVSKRFPADERFALTDQLRRAAVSIPSNIAEGNGRESERAYLSYCLVAHGSLREVETQLHIAHRLGYLDKDASIRLRQLCGDVGGPLRGLIGYLRKQSERKGIREDDVSPYDAAG